MTLLSFLDNHLILYNLLPCDETLSKLKDVFLSKEGVDDIIVDRPIEFVDIVLQNGYYISSITWWDRVNMDGNSLIGMGGPRDPRDPEAFFFAEAVHLYKVFNESATKEDYCEYINDMLSTYPSCDLYPGFDIRSRIL